MVHTGANSQLGGLKDGLCKVVNHPFTDDEVKNPATAPTAKGIVTATINFNIGFIECIKQ